MGKEKATYTAHETATAIIKTVSILDLGSIDPSADSSFADRKYPSGGSYWQDD